MRKLELELHEFLEQKSTWNKKVVEENQKLPRFVSDEVWFHFTPSRCIYLVLSIAWRWNILTLVPISIYVFGDVVNHLHPTEVFFVMFPNREPDVGVLRRRFTPFKHKKLLSIAGARSSHCEGSSAALASEAHQDGDATPIDVISPEVPTASATGQPVTENARDGGAFQPPFLNLSGPEVDAAHALVEHSEGAIIQHAAAPQRSKLLRRQALQQARLGRLRKEKEDR
jgi:hypothetical protein